MKDIESLIKKHKKIKLDVGCGQKIASPDHIGIDKESLPNVDIVLDLETDCIPFPSNCVDEINASHILEHLDNYIPVLEEFWRVLKPEAILKVNVPNYKHINAYTDPTHKRVFTIQSFNLFDKRKVFFKESGWYLSHARFEIIKREETERELYFELKTQKKNLLFISPPNSVHIKRWYNSLSIYGHKVNIASRSLKGIADFSIGSSNSLERFEKFNGMNENIQKILSNNSFDVVHAHFATCYGHVLADIPKNIKKILSVWGEDVLEESFKDERLLQRLKIGIKSADQITTTSVHMKETLMNTFNVSKNKIWVISWGYENIFKHENINEKHYIRFGLSSNKPIFTSCRVCRPQNNIENIIKAFTNLNIDAYLLILTGNIADKVYTKKLKIEYNSNKRIKFLNTLSENDLKMIYNISNVVISIPNIDQLCTTMLEALACGTPVIASDIPVYHERIISKKNGLFVNPNNINQIVQAMHFFSDKSYKDSMSKHAIESVKNDTWENSVRKLQKVYDVPE